MFYKQSLSKVSAFRKIIHDATSQNFNSVHAIKNFGTFTRLNIKRLQIFDVLNNIKYSCLQYRTTGPMYILSGATCHAYYSTTIPDIKSPVKVISGNFLRKAMTHKLFFSLLTTCFTWAYLFNRKCYFFQVPFNSVSPDLRAGIMIGYFV